MSFIQDMLAFLATLLIAPQVPTQPSQIWQGSSAWEQLDDGSLMYSAQSSHIGAICSKRPDLVMNLPVVVQGMQRVVADGKLVLTTGDSQFKNAASLYNVGHILCTKLQGAQVVEWEVYTRTKTLANLSSYPKMAREKYLSEFFNQTLFAAAGAGLPILTLLFFLLFRGSVQRNTLLALTLSCLLFGVFFICAVPGMFNLSLASYHVHRLGDAAIWLGTSSTFYLLYSMNVISLRLFQIYAGSLGLAVLMILSAANLDQAQVGSTFAFLTTFVTVCVILFRNLHWMVDYQGNFTALMQALSLTVFLISCINDILLVSGAGVVWSLFPIGVFGTVFLIVFSINEQIMQVHRERDYLRENLERAVELKTQALKKKSSDLESTLESLKKTQADLVRSAKLASLGTLSAGIAHEINNSLNYVNGSLKPLGKLLMRAEFGEKERGKAHNLVSVMEEGLKLTFDIIANMKQHVGSKSQAPSDIKLKELVDGMLILQKSKMSADIAVVNEVAEDVNLYAYRVSLSEIVMNLVGNAIDALKTINKEDKKVVIRTELTDDAICLVVADNGPGIPKDIQEKLFDPFFTTKEVGKGTGLGLHITHREMERHGGRVYCKSEEGRGTAFYLEFPRGGIQMEEAA